MKIIQPGFIFIFLIILFPDKNTQAGEPDSLRYANDTIYLDSTNFVVKVVESIYVKPAKQKGRVGSAAVYFNGTEFWYIEDYTYDKCGRLKLIDFYELDSLGDTVGELIYYIHFFKNGFVKEKASLLPNEFFENAYSFYYRNGQLKKYFQFKDSLYHGLYREFYKNGQLKTERTYNMGKVESVTAFYDRSGFPLQKGDFENGFGNIFIYNPRGKLKRTYSFKGGEIYRIEKK